MRGRLVALLALAVAGGILSRAGITQGAFQRLGDRLQGRSARQVLRVWDWWSPSTNEKYAAYFAEVERGFEALHPGVDVQFQYVPFGQYEQKMATGLVGNSPPDVFQSSVSFAEGFYDRGMLLPLNSFMERERAQRARRRARGLPVDPGETVDREAFLEAAWRHNTKPDGTVFGIPQILDASCLAWNLDILRKAAESDPEIRGMFLRKRDGTPDYGRLRFDAVRDWEQFRRIARRLTRYNGRGELLLDGRGEPVQTGFALHAHGSGAGPFQPWCAANGSNFQDPAGTRALFADDAGVEAMQFLLDLYWKDRVSPPFRRQMADDEVFKQGNVACVMAGTWSGKYIVRDTEGRIRFDLTPFPPGPRGTGQTTLTWGNMLVISRRCPTPELAWEYVKYITSLEGSLRLLRHIEQNSPRKDFYGSPAWEQMCAQHPYLYNVPRICASGKKLRHTQINAVDHAIQPIFETILLRYPDIERGQGPYPSVRAGLRAASGAVDRVYGRYNTQVALWPRGRQ
jgi:ABC-type glycerol-3-phosphate transport system substrate-binding protein